MYGMNVALPFQHARWIYEVLLVVTLAMIIGVYYFARRKRVF
jgi:Mg2+ and Co2+ transporter CorA